MGLDIVNNVNAVFAQKEHIVVKDCIGVEVSGNGHAACGQVAQRQSYVLVRSGYDIEDLLVSELQVAENACKLLGLGSLELEVLDNHDLLVGQLGGQRALAGELLNLLVELEVVGAGTGTENTAATNEYRRIDVADTCAAATLLLVEFAGRAGNFAALLALVSALTAVSKKLLHIEPYSMLVHVNAEDFVVKDHLTTGVFSLDVIYCEFHYLLLYDYD